MCWWTVLPILVHSQDSAAPAYQTMSGDSNSHSCVRWRVLTLVKNTNGWDYVKLRVRWRVWWPTDINWWGILNLNPTYKKRYLLYCVPATPNTYVLQSRDFSVILLLLVFLQRQIRSSLFAEVGDPTYDDVVDGTVALNHKRTHTLISLYTNSIGLSSPVKGLGVRGELIEGPLIRPSTLFDLAATRPIYEHAEKSRFGEN